MTRSQATLTDLVAAVRQAIAVPLARQGAAFAGQVPSLLADARAGRGPVGELLTRLNAVQFVAQHQDRIGEFAAGLGPSALSIAGNVVTGVAATVTIFIYLMVLEGPQSITGTLALFAPVPAQRIRHVGRTAPRRSPATCPAIC